MNMRQGIVALLLAAASAWGQAAGDPIGQSLLETHQWEKAAQEFDRVVAKGSPLAESALYWKAYALNKGAFRGEALAALAELRKSYPMSRWLQDAAAMEIEIRRAAGENVTPESLADDELKLLAIDGLMRSDPERAIPAIEAFLKQSHSPRSKRDALFVVAQSPLPKAQQLLERIARGNEADLRLPDLQASAVTYIIQQRLYHTNLGQTLFEIYNSSGDALVKVEAENGLRTIGDTQHLSQIPADTLLTPPSNLQVAMARLLNAVQEMRLAKAAASGNAVTNYLAQKDRAGKLGVIELYQKEPQALIAIGRIETDPGLKRKIVEHLIDLNTPEAKEYLLDVLK
jgi:hypothetical protein